MNYAVNNDGTYYPRLTPSYSNPRTPVSKLVDGNYWYHRDPPNRWTCEGSVSAEDWLYLELGTERTLEMVRLYFLDDGKEVVLPAAARVEYWDGEWRLLRELGGEAGATIEGHRPTELRFDPINTKRLKVTFRHQENVRTGLTEVEFLGRAKLPVEAPPHPTGNLAYRPGDKEFPKATASYADRFGGQPKLANDGLINFLPTPTNRWTSYESPAERDWLEIDFGEDREFNQVELAIYDDRGGVQAPQSYELEYWDANTWQPIKDVKKTPEKPVGGEINKSSFSRVQASKLRIWFQHAGKARSGVTEVFVWNE